MSDWPKNPWIGVDLDKTLATHTPGQGDTIGEPVPLMMARVRDWIDQGKRVKIVTARAAYPELIPAVRDWLREHNLPDLEITCSKDLDMTQLWDDSVVQVVPNTGEVAVQQVARELTLAWKARVQEATERIREGRLDQDAQITSN